MHQCKAAQIGGLIGNDTVRNIGVFISLVNPADALSRRGAYLQPAAARGLQMTPFSSASVPNLTMVAWAVLFVVATMAFALRQFRSRALWQDHTVATRPARLWSN